jgi:hypothetical protein
MHASRSWIDKLNLDACFTFMDRQHQSGRMLHVRARWIDSNTHASRSWIDSLNLDVDASRSWIDKLNLDADALRSWIDSLALNVSIAKLSITS